VYSIVDCGVTITSYLGDEGGRLRCDKHDDNADEHDRDVVLVAVRGATTPRQLTHHLRPHPPRGTQRHHHPPTENSQRRQRNDEHNDAVQQVEIDDLVDVALGEGGRRHLPAGWRHLIGGRVGRRRGIVVERVGR